MISKAPNTQPEASRSDARAWRLSRIATIFFVALVLVLAATLAYLTANPDPYNADIVANFVSMLDGYTIPGNTFYLPAHSNASKLPQMWLAVQLFGYSNRSIALTDFIDTFGFYLLTFGVLIWAFGHWRRAEKSAEKSAEPSGEPSGRLIDIGLGCGYLILLSAQWYGWIVHPGLRNIELGAGLLWVAVVLFSRRRWALIAMVPLGVFLLIGDPWILTAFFVPAVLAVFLDTMNQLGPVGSGGRWRAGLSIWQDVVRAVLVAAAVVGVNYLLRRIGNASGLFYIVNTEQELQVASLDIFGHNVGITLEVIGQMFNMWVPGRPMISLHVIRALGNAAVVGMGVIGLVIGARSPLVHLRRFSLFALLSCGLGLGLYVFSNFAIDQTTGRYLIFLPIGVVIGVIFLMAHWVRQRNAWQFIALPILIGTIILNTLVVREWLQVVRAPGFRAPERQITAALAALQAEGVTLGYAEYWQSLSYTMQLGKASLIAPVICDGQNLMRYQWLSQRAWYEPALQPALRPALQPAGQSPVAKSFLIVDQLTGPRIFDQCTRDDLMAQFGPPSDTRIVEYQQQPIAEIWVWDKNIAADLRP